MIEKTDKYLLTWIYELVLDFEAEDDESGLTWDSTHEEALAFLNSIPQKERVQKYYFYGTRTHFFVVDVFCDVENALKAGILSDSVCRQIIKWNHEAGHDDWDMSDVYAVLND